MDYVVLCVMLCCNEAKIGWHPLTLSGHLAIFREPFRGAGAQHIILHDWVGYR